MNNRDFSGRLVVSFESRRAAEMASLIERHGGVAVAAPSLREVSAQGAEGDLPEGARKLADALASGSVDVLVFLTGTGVRGFVEAVRPRLDPEAFVAALGALKVVARGPKPARALRDIGLRDFVTVGEPNTYREVVEALDKLGPLSGLRVAVQEYGVPNTTFYEALAERGAEVLPLSIYKYALPEDTAPLRRALHRLANEEVKIALFTSRSQVEHALLVAAEEGIEAPLRKTLLSGLVGSIGPVCSEALRQEGFVPDVEPEHPKMGHLVKEAALRADEILAAKTRI